MYTQRKLTPQQRESAKKIICSIIDDDGSAFFFAGTPNPKIRDKAITVCAGNSEHLIRSLATESAKNPMSANHILIFIEHVIHICRLSGEIIRETFKLKAKNN